MLEILKQIPRTERLIDSETVARMIRKYKATIPVFYLDIPQTMSVDSDVLNASYNGDTSMFYTPLQIEANDSFVSISSEDGFSASLFAKNSVVIVENLLVNICSLENSLLLVERDVVVNFLIGSLNSLIVVDERSISDIHLNPLPCAQFSGTKFYCGHDVSVDCIDQSWFT